jgi:hypothetical protein
MARLKPAVLLLVCALGASSAQASSFGIGQADVTIGGVVSAGTAIRTRSAEQDLTSRANGPAVGIPGNTLPSPSGRNQDDGNLNYRRGDPVSTVIKTLIDVDVKYGDIGAFVRASAWRDFTLTDGRVAWGNVPNNYTPGTLGETSNSPYGRYSGAALLDANVYGNTSVGGMPLFARVGNQLLPWGVPATIAGGLSALNPINNPAARRPGALPEEVGIPFPAAFARLGVTSTINVEAFYQFAFQRSEPLGCGTFFSSVDYMADRCDKIMFGPGTDRDSLAAVSYAKRAPDLGVSNNDQFGIGFTYRMESIATQFGAYYSQHHARNGLLGVIKAQRTAGTPFQVGDPDGLNPKYFVQYPERLRVFAFNAITRTVDTTLFAEVVHRLNSPLQLNAADLSNAANSNIAPTLIRDEYSAVPLGGIFAAYDRYATTDILLGGSHTFGGILGAKATTLGGEFGFKYVHNLPDPNVRRYGRSDVFGSVPFNGVCAVVGPGLTCSNDGFVSQIAYGARVRGALSYVEVFPNTNITPSVSYGYDLRGWSYDGVFNEGRQFAVVGVRAEYNKRYTAEIAYLPTWGGKYNALRDRDVMTLAVSARF